MLGVRRLKFRTLRKLRKHLKLLAAEANSCVIRGTWNGTEPIRRRKTHFEDRPQAWVMLDIDGMRAPKHLRGDYSGDHAAYAITQLPTEFQGVSCVWQASASACKSRKVLKLHLWFKLSRPLTSTQLRAWLRDCKAIDRSTLRVVQPHYTAAPIGAAFYKGERIGLLESALDVVPVPEDISDAEEHKSSTEIPLRLDGSANVSRETCKRSLKTAEKRAQKELDNCSVAYQSAYTIGTILGPSVALETWNDAEHGHETWEASGRNVAQAWGERVAAIPGASHGAELYVSRVYDGVVWGVCRERERLNTQSAAVVEKQVAATKSLRERLLRKLGANAGSEAKLKEIGKELGRVSRGLDRKKLIALMVAESGFSEQQVSDALEAGEEEQIDADAWREGLLMTGKHADEIVACDNNLLTIYAEYPGFMSSFRINLRTKQLEATDSNVLGLDAGAVNIDKLIGLLVTWFAGLGCQKVSLRMAEATFRTAMENFEQYDPFLQLFPEALYSRKKARKKLQKIQPKLDHWLVTHFGCANKAFIRSVASKTLIAAVARAVQPGAQVDTMLILQGEQGIGKTQVLRTLGGVIEQGYQELLDTRDKDAIITMNDGLVVEVAELRALRNAQEEHTKAFLIRKRDRIRAPYARVARDFDRRIIFVGTTNDDEFLSDYQNRRFWGVSCKRICKMTTEEAIELWREAALRYASGETWWLEGDEIEMQKQYTERFMQSDIVVETLAQLLKDKTQVTFAEACSMAYPNGTLPGNASMRISRALKLLGFAKKKTRDRKARFWART